MTLEEILLAALHRGVQLWREGDALKFRAPKGALEGELLESLKARKAEITTLLEPGCTYALASYAQERLWFLDRLAGGEPIYNMSEGLFRFHGHVDAAKIEQALRAIFQRHEPLRTRFSEFAGRPVQVIEREAQLQFTTIDTSTHVHPNAEAVRLAAEAVRQRFDLQHGPLFKAVYYPISDHESLLVLPMHHIVFDGWSAGVLVRELSALYDGADIQPLALPYAEFAHRQRAALENGDYAKELDYWRARLGDLPPVVELPLDRPRAATPAYRGRKVSVNLPREWTDLVHRSGQSHGATPFMTLVAGYFAFLYHYTRETDLVVGSPIAGRTIPGTGDLIGFFVNSVALRVQAQPDITIAALLTQVRAAVLEAFSNQSLPFEKLVEILQPERDLSGNPFFRTMFVLENAPFPEMTIAGGRLEPEVLPTAAAKFDLTFALFHLEGTYRLTVEYDADLFDAETIDQWMRHYEHLLQHALQSPDARLLDLTFLSPDEQRHLLLDLNDTSRDFAIHTTALDELEAIVHSTPDAIAVVDGVHTLTYLQLWQAAQGVAGALPQTNNSAVVAILLERGAQGVQAAIAAWMRGAAYLPIDPAYPPGRIRGMIEDAGVEVVITTSSLTHLLQGVSAAQILVEDAPAAHAPLARPALHDLAYVIFTSGSTGRPKGVMVRHHALINLIRWHQREFALRPGDRTSQVAGPAFDASVWEIWPTLTIGASLHFAPANARESGELARDWLLANSINVGFLPTPLAEACLDLPWPPDAPLRYLLTGGDRLTRLPHSALPFTLVNNYGPTENTVVSTSIKLSADEESEGLPSIGIPIANTRAYVLNDRRQICAPGAHGELYVAGDSLADGYINRPDMTAERFVTLMLPNGITERAYMTGDLVRWRRDGQLEFLGRTDQQVKVRGFRIELGEIEAVLREHPQVHQAAVIAAPDQLGGNRLIAYVVPGAEPAAEDGTQAEGISHWQELYDTTYAAAHDVSDETLNITGWNSSYTGGPIPPHEMEEWVVQTVAWAAQRPLGRVLEIGCGTGMLLARLAPQSERYEAWDFSRVALQGIRDFIANKPYRDRVTLRQRLANEICDVETGAFDTILMNSVIQYFPTPEYFIDVLRHAARIVGPGGRILVGDVRSREMLHTYAASVEHFQSGEHSTAEDLRRRTERRAHGEEELVISPQFFTALAAQLPTIGTVEITPKLGKAVNELTRFRYHVCLHGEYAAKPLTPERELAWPGFHALRPPNTTAVAAGVSPASTNPTPTPQTTTAVAAGVSPASTNPPPTPQTTTAVAAGVSPASTTSQIQLAPGLLLRDIPNARLAQERPLLHWLDSADPRDHLPPLPPDDDGVIPDDLIALAQEAGLQVRFDWSRHDRLGHFDALFVAADTTPDFVFPAQAPARGTPESLANRPMQAQFVRKLAPILQDHLRNYLPSFMVPGAFVALDKIPLTPNGKVDRRALPSLEQQRSEAEFTAPRTDTEQLIADLWKQLLNLDRVGVTDDFFSLGGHSLLATQLASRLRQATGLEVPIRALFQHPTVELQARFISSGAASDEGAITPAPHDMPIPLSYSQRRLWFLHRLDPESTAYNIPVALRLRGTLNRPALDHALRDIVSRHESLRTSFPLRGEEPVQHIAPAAHFEPIVIDVASPDTECALRRHIDEESEWIFDIEHGPLFRATLLRLAPDDHALILNMHHIISDGWSAGILMDELTRLYQQHAKSDEPALPPLPIQYADYALWQQRTLCGARLDDTTQYWVDYLGREVPPLDLPTDRPRPRRQRFQGAMHRFELPPALAAPLRDLAGQQGATLFMLTLASLKVLLYRWTGQTDFAIGTPIANRTRGEVEGLIGFFVNTLVMRTPISPHESFNDFLARVKQGALGAFAHQDMPFERLVEVLDPIRDPSRMPLYQVMFVFENMPRVQLDFEGLRIETIEIRPSSTKADMNIHLEEHGHGLRGYIQYDTDLFDPNTIDWLVQRWTRLLHSIAREATQPVSSLPLYYDVDHTSATDVLAPFEDPGFDRLRDAVDTWAAEMGNNVFWQSPSRTCTYADFAALVHRIAAAIADAPRVGLYFEKSPEAIAAMLAAQRAGVPYIPLDPTHPESRLQLIANDAALEVVLTQQTLLLQAQNRFSGAPAVAGSVTQPPLRPQVSTPLQSAPHDTSRIVRIIDVDSLPQASAPMAPESELAYIMYTSGSTGTPKGVTQTPRNMMHFVREYARMLGLTREDRLSFIPGYTVDAAIMDAGGALFAGATLVPIDLLKEGMAGIASRCESDSITILHMTPSVFRVLMLEYPEPHHYRTVRAVVLGGEETRPGDWDSFRQSFPAHAALVNLYGQTESSFVAWQILRHHDADSPAAVPIGKSIQGARLHLCNPDGASSEPHGEIVIASEYLTPGYHNDPARNAAVLSTGDDGIPRYRTGDYGRRQADGSLVFLGRIDDQRKVRGYRIELAEVEAALRAAPGVHEAAAAVLAAGTPHEMLAAWVRLEKEDAATQAAILQACREKLPPYMVPTRLAILPAIPKTATGKINRRALVEQGIESPASNDDYIPPRNETERRLAEIWCDLLEVPRAGAEDSFFELGGHSLLATRMASRIRSVFDTELPLQVLFDDPRLSAIAAEIDTRRKAGMDDEAPPLLPRIHEGPAPLSFSQQRLWFLDQLEPGQSVYNMTGAIRLTGQLNHDALTDALARIIERHETLRTTFTSEDGIPLQVIHPPHPPALDIEWASEDLAALQPRVLAWGEEPFDLATGPLLRLRLFRISETDHLLGITLHHIIADGWSIGRFMQELATLYAARLRGNAPRLPHLPVQYADYAQWQRAWLHGPALDRQLNYWRSLMSPAPAPLQLPTDRPRPTLQSYRGAVTRFAWPPALLARLQQTCRDRGVTPFMFALAALQVVLHRWTGQHDIIIGSPIANRTRRETENLIGFFLNTLLMRGQVGPATTFDDLLTRARESALGAYAHQDLPFEKLVEAIAPSRDLSRMPLFQVMLVFQNTPKWRLDLPGLRAEMVEIDPTTTKLDLNLHLRETDRGLEGLLQYASDLFNPATIDNLLDNLRTHLEYFIDHPQAQATTAPWQPINTAHAVAGSPHAVAGSPHAVAESPHAVAGSPDPATPRDRTVSSSPASPTGATPYSAFELRSSNSDPLPSPISSPQSPTASSPLTTISGSSPLPSDSPFEGGRGMFGGEGRGEGASTPETLATITTIWCEILGHATLPPHAHFFDYGGHSLQATQVTARIEKRLGIRVPVRRLFEHPTLADFAASVESAHPGGTPSPASESRASNPTPHHLSDSSPNNLTRFSPFVGEAAAQVGGRGMSESRASNPTPHHLSDSSPKSSASPGGTPYSASESRESNPTPHHLSDSSPNNPTRFSPFEGGRGMSESRASNLTPHHPSDSSPKSSTSPGGTPYSASESRASNPTPHHPSDSSPNNLTGFSPFEGGRGMFHPAPSQQRLWFLEKLNPGTSAYHITGTIRLKGSLHHAPLQRALQLLAARHEVLRSAIIDIEGRPRVQVFDAIELPLDNTTITDDDNLDTLLADFASIPFDLSRPPLMRARLYQVSPTLHYLAIVIHHIISDGWSIGVLARDLGELYTAELEQRAPALPALPLQYLDFAAWQRAQLEQPEFAPRRDHWLDTLRGVQDIDLPLDHNRPAIQQFDGNTVALRLSQEENNLVASICRAHGITPFMLFISVYAILLTRYARQQDFAIAVPFANRTHEGLGDLIGFFVNTLAIRLPLKPEDSFAQNLAAAKARVLDAFDSPDIPFELLVQALNPERDTSRTPLTQVAFAMQNTPTASMQMPGVEIARHEMAATSTRYDMELHIRERAGETECVLFYATSLFAQDSMRQFLENWVELLRQLCNAPASPIAQVHGARAEYVQSLYEQHRRTARQYPANTRMDNLVAHWAEQTPHAIALREGDTAISYAELDTRAEHLAHTLRGHGIHSGDFVATYMDRGHGLVLWLLAILKAGAVYVPLDTAYPEQRVQFMLEDSGAKLLITTDALRDKLPGIHIPIVTSPTTDTPPQTAPAPLQDGLAPAYLMYTSGSTGTPKGVLVPHRAIARLVQNTDYIDIRPGDTIAHISNTSFDAATFEIWGALCNGASLLILSRETVLALPTFLRTLESENVTSLFITTALFNQIARTQPAGLHSLRDMLFGGEASDPDAVRAVLDAGPPQRLLHVYGPTETTTYATWHKVETVSPQARTIPIGGPIANTTCYLLDEHQRITAPGIPAELYIGGPGVALGYHQRPDLTAARFVPDLFAGGDDARLYRTGDLVRLTPHGLIEFLDRLDGQVKLRGFRIELGEIETALRALDAISDATVFVREDRPGDRRLVAYVVATDNLDERDTQQQLGARLPKYMVPSHIVQVPAIPLTPNGKVDRRALPAPERRDTTDAAPLDLSPTESAIATIWRGILGDAPPDRDTSFFDVGGNSLLLVELTAKVGNQLQVEVPLTEIFQCPSLREIAAAVERAQGGGTAAAAESHELVVTLRATGDALPLFCIAPAGGTIYPYYALVHKLTPGFPVYGLMDPAFKRGDEPLETIEAMAQDYIEAIRAIQPHGPYRIVGWSFGGLVAFEIAQQLTAAGEQVQHVGVIEFRIPEQHEQTISHRAYAIAMSTWHNLQHIGSTIGNMIDGLLVSIAYLENVTKKDRKLDTWQQRLAGRIIGWSWKLLLKQANLAHILTEESQMMLIKHPSTKNFARISAANLKAMHRYTMRPYPGDVTLYRASNQPSQDHNKEVLEGWRTLVHGNLTEHVIRGDHFSIMRQPDVEQLAEKLGQSI